MNETGKEWPVVIPGLSAIAERFDHVLLDQWGVLHHGRAVFPEARAAVAALRHAGKRVLVLSNSGKRAAENAARLAALGLPEDAYDGIVTSGEACWQLLRRREIPTFDRLGKRCFLMSRGNDRSVVDGLDLTLVDNLDDMDFILMAGVDDGDDPELWRMAWHEPVAHRRPMICANPDLTMITGAGLAPAPGSFARVYSELGGDVIYVGKPHAPIYQECLRLLGHPDPRRVLAVGDSLDHDIRGGRGMGMGTALVTSGILAPEFGAATDEAAMAETAFRLARATGDPPDFLLTSLVW